MYDQLTGLPLETFVKEKYPEYLKNIKSYMVMIDFSKLKYINDNFGHEEGDKSLILFSKLAKKYFSNSIVSRLHGDEFCILTKNSNEEIKNNLQKIAIEINKSHMDNHLRFPFTFNSGIKKCDENYDIIKRKADLTMYEAKKNDELFLDFSFENFFNTIEEEKFIKRLNEVYLNKKYKFKYYYQTIKDYKKTNAEIMEIKVRNENGTKLFDYNQYQMLKKNHKMKQIDIRLIKDFFNNYDKEDFFGNNILVNINYQTLMAREYKFNDSLVNILKTKEISPMDVILGINIYDFDEDIFILADKINHLKSNGFKICLDNMNILSLQPIITLLHECDIDYVKFRNLLINDDPSSKKTEVLLKTLLYMVKELNVMPIFVRVENQDILDYIDTLCEDYLLKGSYIVPEKTLQKQR